MLLDFVPGLYPFWLSAAAHCNSTLLFLDHTTSPWPPHVNSWQTLKTDSSGYLYLEILTMSYLSSSLQAPHIKWTLFSEEKPAVWEWGIHKVCLYTFIKFQLVVFYEYVVSFFNYVLLHVISFSWCTFHIQDISMSCQRRLLDSDCHGDLLKSRYLIPPHGTDSWQDWHLVKLPESFQNTIGSFFCKEGDDRHLQNVPQPSILNNSLYELVEHKTKSTEAALYTLTRDLHTVRI